MNTTVLAAVAQILVLLAALAAVHAPLGAYMARTFTSRMVFAVTIEPSSQETPARSRKSAKGMSDIR